MTASADAASQKEKDFRSIAVANVRAFTDWIPACAGMSGGGEASASSDHRAHPLPCQHVSDRRAFTPAEC